MKNFWKDLKKPILIQAPMELKGVVICTSGQKVRAATSSAYAEYFLPGTEPTGFCDNPTPQAPQTITPSP